MLTILAIATFLAAAAPWIVRWTGAASGWLLGAAALGSAVALALVAPSVEVVEWIPGLDVTLALRMDGLARLFAVLVTGVGALVAVYGGKYLEDDAHRGRFQGFLFLFLASMLGIVLADDLFFLLVAWELTTIASYFLIAHEHPRREAREAARQALFVTHVGGLALIPGFVLLGMAGGTFRISELVQRADVIQADPSFGPALVLIVLGAATKSAQFPFHFWLPRAMEAPTPVSAYLHSATMVKAGVFLLARLAPVFADQPAFRWSLVAIGGLSLVVGAVLAYAATEMKRILAYTTVSALGAMVLGIGIGSSKAIGAALLFLLAHALYKATLFLTSGILTHATHQSDAEKLSGLWRAAPVTAVAAMLAALSMSGIPPLLGYVAKESLLESTWGSPWLPLVTTLVTVFAGGVFVSTAFLVGIRPFAGRRSDAGAREHPAAALWTGPLMLALGGLFLPLVPSTIEPALSGAASAVSGEPESVAVSLWHGLVPALGFGAASIALGLVLFASRRRLRAIVCTISDTVGRLGPEAAYGATMRGLSAVAEWQTRVLQSGRLGNYVAITLLAASATIIWRAARIPPEALRGFVFGDIRPYGAGLALVMLAAGVAAAISRSRLAAVTAMGVVGFGVAMIFALHGAPDLAKAQFAIESLMVVMFVLVFLRIPTFVRPAGPVRRAGDALVAVTVGTLMASLVLVATRVQFGPPISHYFARESLPSAHARNVVNAILVDFRALDTLGELTVLTVASVGAFVMLRPNQGSRGAP